MVDKKITNKDRKLVEQKLENKKISELTGENSSRLSESDRKLVNSVLTMGSKIPGIGAMISAGKSVGSILNAIGKLKRSNLEKLKMSKTKERPGAVGSGIGMGPVEQQPAYMAKGGMVNKKKKSKKAGRLAKRGYGSAKK